MRGFKRVWCLLALQETGNDIDAASVWMMDRLDLLRNVDAEQLRRLSVAFHHHHAQAQAHAQAHHHAAAHHYSGGGGDGDGASGSEGSLSPSQALRQYGRTGQPPAAGPLRDYLYAVISSRLPSLQAMGVGVGVDVGVDNDGDGGGGGVDVDDDIDGEGEGEGEGGDEGGDGDADSMFEAMAGAAATARMMMARVVMVSVAVAVRVVRWLPPLPRCGPAACRTWRAWRWGCGSGGS